MIEKMTIAVSLSLVGGIFLLLNGLFFIVSGNVFMILVFGSDFLLLAFMLIGSLVIIMGSAMMNNSTKTVRIWGLIVIILGIMLGLLDLCLISFLRIPAILGGSLPTVSGLMGFREHYCQ